jgi:hypothetical protein
MTTEVKRIGDLEIDEDILAARIVWKAQRVGWFLLAHFLGAAVAGLLGSGPLSQRELISPSGHFRVQYNRFLHRDASDQLKVLLAPKALVAPVSITFSSEKLADLNLEIPSLEPTQTITSGQEVTYRFLTHASEKSAEVIVELKPKLIGNGLLEVSLNENEMGKNEKVVFDFFVYP